MFKKYILIAFLSSALIPGNLQATGQTSYALRTGEYDPQVMDLNRNPRVSSLAVMVHDETEAEELGRALGKLTNPKQIESLHFLWRLTGNESGNVFREHLQGPLTRLGVLNLTISLGKSSQGNMSIVSQIANLYPNLISTGKAKTPYGHLQYFTDDGPYFLDTLF